MFQPDGTGSYFYVPNQNIQPKPFAGAGHLAQVLKSKTESAQRNKQQKLKDLWGDIRVGESVLLSEKASCAITPKVKSNQGHVRLDGVVRSLGQHGTADVEIAFVTRNSCVPVQCELHCIAASELEPFAHPPTEWPMKDLRKGAVARCNLYGLKDGWEVLKSDRYMEH